jgi:hypothetical protein
MTGIDPEDPATAASHGKASCDYTQYLDPQGLQGARIGVARKYCGFRDYVDALLADALQVMKDHGATIVDPADIPTHGKFGSLESTVLLYELKADMNAYLARLGPGAPMRSLTDLIDFNERHKEQELLYFHRRTCLCHGPAQRRSAFRGQFRCGRGGGISEHHVAGGVCVWTARGDFVVRTSLERTDADQAGVRLRTGHAASATAAIPAHRRSADLSGVLTG